MNTELPELPNDLEIFLDNPYGGLFGDKTQVKIIEEIVADPYQSYREQYFEEITDSSLFSIRKSLNSLIKMGLIVKDKDDYNNPIYRANLKSKKLVALTLLSLACIDDRDGTECMDFAIFDYYFKVLKNRD